MQHGSLFRTLGFWLAALALAGALGLALAQQKTVRKLSDENRRFQTELASLEQSRAEPGQTEQWHNLQRDLEQLREDNRDLLRLRNEVRTLREKVKEIETLRAANANLLQALQGTRLSPDQQSSISAARKEGAVLGVYALSANDPRGGPAANAGYSGAVVMGIDTNSPAALADLKIGDVIVRVDGRLIENVGQLQSEMLTRNPGDTVTLDVMRETNLVRILVQTRAWTK